MFHTKLPAMKRKVITMYLTYAEYKEVGGALDSVAFLKYEFKARKAIDRATHGRISTETASEAVKRLTYELINIAVNEESAVVSESVGGWSKSFAQKDFAAETDRLIREYLSDETTADGTPLLYCGVNV